MKAALFFLFLFPLCVHAQEQARPESRSRTVAIRSAKRSFFPDYTIDSLVSGLNRLNPNPGIRFCRSTDDDTPSGFYADYLVNIDFDVRFAHLEAPPPSDARLQYLQVPNTRRGNNGASNIGTTGQYVPEQRADFKMKAGEGMCTIKILERRKNDSVTREYLRASSENDDALQYQLVAGVVNYLLYRFGK